uniref:gem-associated protein 4 isoform X2 n=1 Tax=Myxine glutinosa TaxID=7769 RepID=UPI00358E80D5
MRELLSDPLLFCHRLARFHGALLLAERLFAPRALDIACKADWQIFRKPLLEVAGNICAPLQSNGELENDELFWQLKLVALLWMKVLHQDDLKTTNEDADIPNHGHGEDLKTHVERTSCNSKRDSNDDMQEDLFFAVNHMLPRLSHGLVFEFARELRSAESVGRLLMLMPLPLQIQETQALATHTLDGGASTTGLDFFLTVWRSMLRLPHQCCTTTDTGKVELAFTHNLDTNHMQPATKRARHDTPFLSHASPGLVLAMTLKEVDLTLWEPRRWCQAISVLSDTLSKVIYFHCTDGSLNECTPLDLPLVQEQYLERVASLLHFRLSAVCKTCEGVLEVSPSCLKWATSQVLEPFIPSARAFMCPTERQHALDVLLHLLRNGQLNTEIRPDQAPDLERYCAVISLHRLAEVLDKSSMALCDADLVVTQETCDVIKQACSIFQKPEHNIECKLKEALLAAVGIIDLRLQEHVNMLHLLASRADWIMTETGLGCLERSVTAALFTRSIVITLSKTIAGILSDVVQETSILLQSLRRLRAVLLSYFDLLDPEARSGVLSTVLEVTSGQGLGFHTLNGLKSEVYTEVTLAFNRIAEDDHAAALLAVTRAGLHAPNITLQWALKLAMENVGTAKVMASILRSIVPFSQPLNMLPNAERFQEGGLLLASLRNLSWEELSFSESRRQCFLNFISYLVLPESQSVDNAETASVVLGPPLSCTALLRALSLSNLHRSTCQELDLALEVFKKLLGADRGNWLNPDQAFPTLLCLTRLLHKFAVCWEQGKQSGALCVRERATQLVEQICKLVLQMQEKTDLDRSVKWLYHRTLHLDWCARLQLAPLTSQQFPLVAPSSLFAICPVLGEQHWAQDANAEHSYGPGTGLLAWLECCAMSSSTVAWEVEHALHLDKNSREEVCAFGKGILLALSQLLPQCTIASWHRVLSLIHRLVLQGALLVPYSPRHARWLPLLDLRPCYGPLCLSQLLVRVFQLLVGNECGNAGRVLSVGGWTHAARLAAITFQEALLLLQKVVGEKSWVADSESFQKVDRGKEELEDSTLTCESLLNGDTEKTDHLWHHRETLHNNVEEKRERRAIKKVESALHAEVACFALSQLFAHMLYLMDLLPPDARQPLFPVSLELLAQAQSSWAVGGLGPMPKDELCQYLEELIQCAPSDVYKDAFMQQLSRF